MQDWFTTWFNSPYYHLLYRDRDNREAERFIDRLVQALNLPVGSRVLDLACGKGRHSLQFRNHGFEVIGVDLAAASIEEAEKLQEEGLEFFVQDMRNLYWQEHFHLVVNLFTSFGYFHNAEDDQRTISSAADSLKPEGLFVLDFMNAVKVKRNLVLSEQKIIDGVVFDISRQVSGKSIVKKIHVSHGEVELDFQEEVDALEISDFKRYFDVAGLELVDTFGNYELEAFNSESSDRLILVVKKHSE